MVYILLALQVKVGKVASFMGKIFVVQCSTTKTTNILPNENYPLYFLVYILVIVCSSSFVGVFDAARLADALYKECGPGTIYEKTRHQSGQPKKGPWTNHNLKIFIANREDDRQPEADPTSKDPDGLCKAVVVIASLSGTASVLDKVGECVGTTQVSLSAGKLVVYIIFILAWYS